MAMLNNDTSFEPSPIELRDQRVIMVRAPSSGYAGYVGAEAVVTDVANGTIYVLFESGIRECYPSKHFRDLFRMRAWRRAVGG